MPMASLPSRVGSVLRDEGVAGLLRHLGQRLKLHRVWQWVILIDLERDLPSFPIRKRLQVRRVMPADSDLIAALVTYDRDAWDWARTPDDVIWRLTQDRNDCYVALSDGRIVSSLWLSSTFYESDLQRWFTLGPDELYIQQIYTPRDLRGWGIIFHLIHAVHPEWRARGFRRGVGLVFPHNRDSLRVVERLGGKQVGRAGYLEWLGLRFNFLFAPPGLLGSTRRFFIGKHRA